MLSGNAVVLLLKVAWHWLEIRDILVNPLQADVN